MSQGSCEHGEILQRVRRGLFRNALTASIGQGGVILFGLGAMAVTTRLLGAEGYGRLTVFFMALGIVTQLGLSWANPGLVRFGREDMKSGAGVGPTFWARIGVYFLSAAVVTCALFLLREQVASYLDLGRHGARILLVYALLLTCVEMLTAAFQAMGRFRAMAALPACWKFLNFLFLLVLFVAVARRSDTSAVLTTHVAALACVLLGAVVAVASTPVGRPHFDLSRMRRMASYAWPIVFGGLANVVVEWIDTIVIRAYRPLAELGAYGAAYQSVNALGGVRVAVVAVLWPFIMSLAVAKRHETLRWYLDDLLVAASILIGLAHAVAGAAAEAMPLLFGSEFAPGVLPCQTLVAGVAFTCVYALLYNVANAYDRVKYVVAVSLVTAGVNLTCDLVLVPTMGPMGAALSTLAAFASGALLCVAVVNGIAPVRGDTPRRRYYALLGLLPAVAIPAMAAGIGSVVARVAAFTIAMGVWCAVVRWTGCFKRSTVERLYEIDFPAPVLAALRGVCAVLAPATAKGG